jgi:hypothetical protein
VIFPGLLRLPSFDLLLSLAALMLVEPSAERFRGGVPLLAALHLGVLVLAVRLVSSTRDSMTLTWALAAPTLAVNIAHLFAAHPALSIANLAMLAIFYTHVIRCLLGYVLRDAVVTVDELFAATLRLRADGDGVRVPVLDRGAARARLLLDSGGSRRDPQHALLRPAVLQLHDPYQHGFRRHPAGGPPGPGARDHRTGDRRDVRGDPDRPAHGDEPGSEIKLL